MASYNPKNFDDIKHYETLQEIITELSEVLLPPERVTVSEAAEKYRVVYNPPAYTGPWVNDFAPYLIEVMDMLESRDYSAVCFVSAAQSLKTELNLNWLSYNVACDPSDFMLVEKSQTEAKNFSMMKVDRLLRHSPEIGSRLIPRRTANNTFDKRFKSGTFLNITWPTVNSLSGKTIRRVALTDYDRMDQNVGGEGSPFDLARRRTNTFKRLGMTYVESSPSFDILDPRWKPRLGEHEAPPCEGILGIYNRGDRRRRYWQCPHCQEWFEPSFSTLRWDESDGVMSAAESVFMACPHCFEANGAIITQSMRNELDKNGVWLRQGETIDKNGVRGGKPLRSDIASFWLKGPNTALGQWKTLVLNYLLAKQDFDSTGNDRPLKTTINTDQGEPYIPPFIAEAKSPEDIMERAKDIGEREVPTNARCLIASVDVQKNRFVIQVHAIRPENDSFDIMVIDRFNIIKSERYDSDGDRCWVNPGAYPEDWDLVTKKVIEKTYPLEGYEDRHMSIKLTLCDSGGREGVTTNAYEYYRNIRNSGYASRFALVKGDGNVNIPMYRKSYPDSQRKDRNAGARGEIPVHILNTNMLKDWLDNVLTRDELGGNSLIFADWLDLDFYKELCAEVKNKNGTWENPKKLRNESTDLICYCKAGCHILKLNKINWDDPPKWLSTWDTNSNVIISGQSVKPESKSSDGLKKLGGLLT